MVEIATRVYRRAEVPHANRVDMVEPGGIGLDFAFQPGLYALAHHRPLLARDREHVLLGVAFDLAPEPGIQAGLVCPVVVQRRLPAIFDGIDIMGLAISIARKLGFSPAPAAARP